jgi:hypothetical protein
MSYPEISTAPFCEQIYSYRIYDIVFWDILLCAILLQILVEVKVHLIHLAQQILIGPSYLLSLQRAAHGSKRMHLELIHGLFIT